MSSTQQHQNRIINLLRINEECSGLSDQELKTFSKIATFSTFQPGQVIFSESQPAQSFFILEKGIVRLNFSRRDPVELHPGQLFGDWAVINNTVRLATAMSKNHSSVLEISATGFFDTTLIAPAISLQVVKSIARKLIQRVQSRSQVSTKILIEQGENEHVEFKSTLRKNLKTNARDPKIELAVLKTIAAFLNGRGGTLLVGVEDSGQIIGIEPDEFPNADKYLLHFSNLLESRLGSNVNQYIHYDLVKIHEKMVLRVDCDPSSRPFFVIDQGTAVEYFFVRNGPSSVNYSFSQAITYIQERF